MVWFHVPLEPDERRDSEVTGPRRCPWNNLSSLLTVSTVQASDFPLPLFNPPSRNIDRHRWPVLRRVAVAARPAAMAPGAPKGPLPLHIPSAARTEERHRCPTELPSTVRGATSGPRRRKPCSRLASDPWRDWSVGRQPLSSSTLRPSGHVTHSVQAAEGAKPRLAGSVLGALVVPVSNPVPVQVQVQVRREHGAAVRRGFRRVAVVGSAAGRRHSP